jgi:hypothetical protein
VFEVMREPLPEHGQGGVAMEHQMLDIAALEQSIDDRRTLGKMSEAVEGNGAIQSHVGSLSGHSRRDVKSRIQEFGTEI